MNKKILYLVNNLSFLISHRLEMVLQAKNKGFEVLILYGEDGRQNYKIFSNNDIKCVKLNFNRSSINPFKEIYTFISIFKFFRKFKPDIVHLITIKAYLYGGIAARLLKVPCVVSAIAGLGVLFNQDKLVNFFRKKFFFLIFSFSLNHSNQIVIVQNTDDQNTLINWLGISKNKIKLIQGSGVDLSKFKKLIEPKSEITVCLASRLLKDKGIFDYLSAVNILNKRKVKAKYLLAGEIDLGNPHSLTEEDIKDIANKKNVKILGHQENIQELYYKSHIVCLPSYYGEGLPKTLIEASAASRAIVTTDHTGCREAIIPNKTGLLVPIKNPIKLANAIEWLIKNPKKRIEMGKAGRKLAEKNFNVSHIVHQHFQIYQSLIDKS